MAQLKDLLVNGDTRVAGKLLVDERSGGHFLTPIHFNSESLPSKTLQYVMGIDGFAEGGQAGWQSKTEFLSDVTSDITSIKNNYVKKAGDTMTGFLTLHANPTANLHAATKQYVDATVENAAKLFTTTTTITTDTASSVVFDTSTVTLSTCLIYYNGLLMTPGVNYSITNNTTIALSGWTANKGDIFTVSGKQANETTATQAIKLTCGNVGSSTKPVYFENGIPVECSKSIGEGYLPLSGGTITGTSGDTPLYLKSASTATWLGFKNSSGTNLGFFGFSGTNIPSVYLDKTYKLLHDGNYNSYSPTLTGGGASGIWPISVGGSATSLSRNDDLNMTSRGVSWFDIDGKAGAVSLVNDTPTNGWWHILRFNHENTNEYYTDLAVPFNYNSLYYKRVAGGTVESNKWIQVLDEKNYTTYAPTKTGGGASGTWGINISGNAVTATSATKATQDGNGANIASTYVPFLKYCAAGINFNTITNSGFYRINNSNTNGPTGGDWGQLLVIHGGGDTITHIYGNHSTGDLWTRSGNPPDVNGSGVWTPWSMIYSTRNITSGTSPLTSGSSGLSNGYIYLQYK